MRRVSSSHDTKSNLHPTMEYLDGGLAAIERRLAFVETEPIDWRQLVLAFSWGVCIFESYLLFVLHLLPQYFSLTFLLAGSVNSHCTINASPRLLLQNTSLLKSLKNHRSMGGTRRSSRWCRISINSSSTRSSLGLESTILGRGHSPDAFLQVSITGQSTRYSTFSNTFLTPTH
jgi:hypothetical protein